MYGQNQVAAWNKDFTNRGEQIGARDVLKLKVEETPQFAERELSQVEVIPGKKATLEQAAELAKQKGWNTFYYNNEEFDITPSTPRTSSTKKRTSSTSTGKGGNTPKYTPPSKTPITDGSNKPTSGYASGSKSTRPLIKSTGKTYQQEGSSKKISTEVMRKQQNGGLVNGQRITFEQGGKIYSGKVSNYNPMTGDFDLY
jgi:hypothetical protein